MSEKILIVIPARMASKRLPGKPLLKIGGTEMILRVADIAQKATALFSGCSYIIATDDIKIESFCQSHNTPVIMTSKACRSGTERIFDTLQKLEDTYDLIINLQGDNPLCPPWFLEDIMKAWLQDKTAQVLTPFVQLAWEELDQLRESKKTTPFSGTLVEVDKKGYAITFSKNIIPAIRKEKKLSPLSPVRRHIGLYAYTPKALKEYLALEKGIYEAPEGLEQMRYIEHQIPIKMVEVSYKGMPNMGGIDSPEDVERAEAFLQSLELSR